MSATRVGTRRILVVDDDDLFGEHAVQLLQTIGHTATFHRGSSGSLYKIKQERANVVLLDVNMPVLDGSRVIRMIRHTFTAGEVAVLLCSDMEMGSLESLATAVGAHGSIPKMYFEQKNLGEIQLRLQQCAYAPTRMKMASMKAER